MYIDVTGGGNNGITLGGHVEDDIVEYLREALCDKTPGTAISSY